MTEVEKAGKTPCRNEKPDCDKCILKDTCYYPKANSAKLK